jgi:uncharacterized membrane protein
MGLLAFVAPKQTQRREIILGARICHSLFRVVAQNILPIGELSCMCADLLILSQWAKFERK